MMIYDIDMNKKDIQIDRQFSNIDVLRVASQIDNY